MKALVRGSSALNGTVDWLTRLPDSLELQPRGMQNWPWTWTGDSNAPPLRATPARAMGRRPSRAVLRAARAEDVAKGRECEWLRGGLGLGRRWGRLRPRVFWLNATVN